MSMPWYVTVVLFILSPVYAILFRERVWPRIQDWWATRSKHRLLLRIGKLERRLAAAELLPAHTEFESEVFQATYFLFLAIGNGFHFLISALFGFFAIFRRDIIQRYGITTTLRIELVFLAALVVNAVVMVAMATRTRPYWEPRSQKWRTTTSAEIENLRAKLT